MRLIGLGGEPASGKTTLFKRLIKEFHFNKVLKWKRIVALVDVAEKLVLMGVYDDKIFSGTDRLSMAVMPDFLEWITISKVKLKEWTIIFEGDRKSVV